MSSKAPTSIKFEENTSKILAPADNGPVVLALPEQDINQIAGRLGFTDVTRARELATALSERVTGGYLPSGWDERCSKRYTPEFCALVSDYIDDNKALDKERRAKKRRARVRHSLTAKNVPNLQKRDFSELSSLPELTINKLQPWAQLALKTTDCPRSFSLWVGRSIERKSDDPSELAQAEQLYRHGLECLPTSDENAEALYLRGGLLRLVAGDHASAAAYLRKSIEAAGNQEEYRALYWLDHALEGAGRKEEAKAARTELFTRFPLNWYTIRRKSQLGIDPLKVFRDAPLYADKYESGDILNDTRLAWLMLLIAAGEDNAAVKRFAEYVARKLPPDFNAAVLQQFSRFAAHHQQYFLQIAFLNRLRLAQAHAITRETLRLLFPKPFFENLDANSQHLDTAILLGLVRQESQFDPRARSGANAMGLLQVLPSTARSIKRKTRAAQLYDYAHNIEIGSKFLLKMIEQFDGSVERALGAYNAGQTHMRRWTKLYGHAPDTLLFTDLIPFRETRDYVPSILRNAYVYHRLFPELGSGLFKPDKSPAASDARDGTTREDPITSPLLVEALRRQS